MANPNRTKESREGTSQDQDLSNLRPSVVLIGFGDSHFSLRPPIARSVEDNWLEVQLGYIEQLNTLAYNANQNLIPVPIVCAGDLLDRWNQPAELVNALLKHLPPLYAVCGNHDLANHNYRSRRRTAYWTLVEAGKIVHLTANRPVEVGGVRLWGWPFGHEVQPCPESHDLFIEVAVVHSYIWIQGKSYPDAPSEKRLRGYNDKLKGYDVALFSDNHLPFMATTKNGTLVVNQGAFIPRRLDEKGIKPSVCQLTSDGEVSRLYLDTKEDKWLEVESLQKVKVLGKELGDFVADLKELGAKTIDFEQAVIRAIDKENLSPEVRQLILSILDEAKDHDRT